MAQPSTPSDRDLLAAVADGDSHALQQLYERHSTWLAVRLRGRCSEPGIVSDVLQETFIAIWRGASRYRGDGEVAAWIWGIGIRRLVSELRKSRSATELPLDNLPVAVDVSAEDLVLRAVEFGSIGAAMASLSPEYRAVIRATVLDGLTTREAARLLGIPPGTVKTRAMRARAKLRAELAGGMT